MTRYIPLSKSDQPPVGQHPVEADTIDHQFTRALADRVADQSELLSRQAERRPSECQAATLAQLDELAGLVARIKAELTEREDDLGPIRGSRLLVKLADLQGELEGLALAAALW